MRMGALSRLMRISRCGLRANCTLCMFSLVSLTLILAWSRAYHWRRDTGWDGRIVFDRTEEKFTIQYPYIYSRNGSKGYSF